MIRTGIFTIFLLFCVQISFSFEITSATIQKENGHPAFSSEITQAILQKINERPTPEKFWKAIKSSDTAYVEKLLSGPDGEQWVNYRDTKENSSCTPLMYAALFGDEAMVHLLLRYKADVNMTDTLGRPALAYATSFYNDKHIELVREICRAADLKNPVHIKTLHYIVIRTIRDYGYEYILTYFQEYIRQGGDPRDLLYTRFLEPSKQAGFDRSQPLIKLVHFSSPRTKKLLETLKYWPHVPPSLLRPADILVPPTPRRYSRVG